MPKTAKVGIYTYIVAFLEQVRSIAMNLGIPPSVQAGGGALAVLKAACPMMGVVPKEDM